MKPRLPHVLLAPSLVVMLGLVAYPLLYNVWLAFSGMNLYTFRDAPFVGLQNFREIFGSRILYGVFAKTLVWTVVNVTLHVGIGVGLALLLDRPMRGRGVYRALLILPWAMPQYITALTWRGLFNYEYGAVNLVLQRVGIQPVAWLSDPTAAFSAAIAANVWLGFPFMMVVALGALQSIPREMYEAVSMDGAGAWQRFRIVTLPMLRPVLAPAVALGLIWTFNNLNVLWLVTEGGKPANQSHILVTYVYNEAFTLYRYGYAAAFSLVIFAVLIVFLVAYLRVTRPERAAAA
jgi:arabinogalactan oligomer/maltooligosaccharide transport system permease protein